MKIYLIGFMGSGKTTMGKKLAGALGYAFFDLDQLIEEGEDNKISEIFSASGENHFRNIEKKYLHETAALDDVVISCGGGTPCYFDNMEWINENGVSVWLNVQVEIILGRLRNAAKKRPLIASLDDQGLKNYIIEKLEERNRFYSKARIIIDPAKLRVNDIAEAIRQLK